MESIVLENGLEYVIVDEIKYLDNNYLYLLNINNDKDFCIRKSIKENGNEIVKGLKDVSEYETALKLYIDKNKKD